jgi:hypothetical protein
MSVGRYQRTNTSSRLPGRPPLSRNTPEPRRLDRSKSPDTSAPLDMDCVDGVSLLAERQGFGQHQRCRRSRRASVAVGATACAVGVAGVCHGVLGVACQPLAVGATADLAEYRWNQAEGTRREGR